MKNKAINRLDIEKSATKDALKKVFEEEYKKNAPPQISVNKFAMAIGGLSALVSLLFSYDSTLQCVTNAFICGSFAGFCWGACTRLISSAIVTNLAFEMEKKAFLKLVFMIYSAIFAFSLVSIGLIGYWITKVTIAHGGTFIWTWIDKLL